MPLLAILHVSFHMRSTLVTTRSISSQMRGGTYQDQVENRRQSSSLPNKILITCALLTLPLIYIVFFSPPSFISHSNFLAAFQAHRTARTHAPVPSLQAWLQCDYSDGKWVWDDSGGGGPRYDSENCDMRSTQKCAINGKPDDGYLHWRWQPAGCNLSALVPAEFLRLVRGKRLAFVGDSTARNQAESLVCFLSTVARPVTVHRYEERLGRKFWRWVFPAPHGVEISTYWSPYLVRAEGKSEDYGMTQDTVFMDALTEPWTADVDAMDIMVISAGHWFRHPAVYYEDGEIVGVYSRPDVNKTDIGYLGVYRKLMRRTLEYIDNKHGKSSSDRDRLVVVATTAPSHFDATVSWNHRDACSRTRPYEEGEVPAEYAELRKAVLEEAARSRRRRVEVLDVTRLASMRRDGHPGAYIFKHAYAGGPVPETVANDCLHWCAPGPVDTFNDMLSQMIAARAGG